MKKLIISIATTLMITLGIAEAFAGPQIISPRRSCHVPMAQQQGGREHIVRCTAPELYVSQVAPQTLSGFLRSHMWTESPDNVAAGLTVDNRVDYGPEFGNTGIGENVCEVAGQTTNPTFDTADWSSHYWVSEVDNSSGRVLYRVEYYMRCENANGG